ncbi:MAG: hypothetical protein CFE24_05055 [Flavobacterium sp. BFFFF2]|nr:MAG: hypothetical protein CFE24_05055 [Flavobacterium sp. BFFFF2]
MKNNNIFLASLFILVTALSFGQVQKAQTLQIGSTSTNTQDASAALQIDDNTRGFLMPRMTTIQRTAILNPAKGLQVYDTDTNTIWYYSGTIWINGTVNNSIFSRYPSEGLIKLNQLSDGITTRPYAAQWAISDNGAFIIGGTLAQYDAKLYVLGTTQTKDLRIFNPDDTGTAKLEFKSGTWGVNYISSTGSDLYFRNGNNFASMRFDLGSGVFSSGFYFTGGNVGINTTGAPTERLDVVGNVKFSGALMPNNTAGTAGQVLTSAGAGVVPTWSNFQSFYTSDGTLTGNRTVTQGTNTLAFTSTATTGTSHFTVDGTTLNVDAVNNRIGIGTAAPSGVLHANGISNTSFDATSAPQSYAPNSTVTIANNNSTAAVNPVSAIQFQTLHNNGANQRVAYIAAVGGTDNFANDLVFGSRNTSSYSEKMRLSAAGNLGIGNSTPTEKLDVTGNIRFSGALMPNNAAGTAGQVLTSAGAGVAPTWTTLPSTFYATNGSLTGNRTVTQGANTLAFTATAVNGFSIDGTTFSVDAANNRIGLGTAAPTSTLQTTGTLALTTATSGTANSVILLASGTFTPPTASTVSGRIYVIRNTATATNVSVDSVIDYGATTAATFTLTPAIGTVMIISDGSSWFRIR